MEVDFLPPAEAELAEAVDYYNEQRSGLGDEFLGGIRNKADLVRAQQSAMDKIWSGKEDGVWDNL